MTIHISLIDRMIILTLENIIEVPTTKGIIQSMIEVNFQLIMKDVIKPLLIINTVINKNKKFKPMPFSIFLMLL
jgi:hypothetical protein